MKYDWVDYLKAFGILLVVFGHAQIGDGALLWIFSFHMPLFFFVSGFLLRPDYYQDSFRTFFRKRISRLLIYFFSFATLCAPVYVLLVQIGETREPLGQAIVDKLYSLVYASGTVVDGPTLYPIVLWFFPALITGLVFLYLVQKSLGAYWGLGVLGLAVLAHIFAPYAIPWEIESGLAASLFLAIGYQLRSCVNIQNSSHRLPAIVALPILAVAAWLAFLNGRIDFRSSDFGNPFIAIISSLLSIFALVVIFQKLPRNRFVESISKNTIYIFPTHLIAFTFFDIFLTKVLKIQSSVFTEVIKAGLVFVVLAVAFHWMAIWLVRFKNRSIHSASPSAS